MIYFDSAATTFQKPRTVADAMRDAMATMSSPGRGGYPAAMRAAEAAFDCRTELAELYHLENPEQVAFTMNATHGLNIAIKSLVPPGGKAVISGYEHNAVTRPLAALGAQVSVAAAPLFQPAAVTAAFDRLNWSASQTRRIQAQRKTLCEIAEIPGSYIITRNLTNLFLDVMANGAILRESMLRYADIMEEELARKKIEMDLLETA